MAVKYRDMEYCRHAGEGDRKQGGKCMCRFFRRSSRGYFRPGFPFGYDGSM